MDPLPPFFSVHLCGACERLRRLVSLVPGRSSLPSHSSKPGLDDVGEHILRGITTLLATQCS
ncbi:unnamed protein product [Musa banksii]